MKSCCRARYVASLPLACITAPCPHETGTPYYCCYPPHHHIQLHTTPTLSIQFCTCHKTHPFVMAISVPTLTFAHASDPMPQTTPFGRVCQPASSRIHFCTAVLYVYNTIQLITDVYNIYSRTVLYNIFHVQFITVQYNYIHHLFMYNSILHVLCWLSPRHQLHGVRSPDVLQKGPLL